MRKPRIGIVGLGNIAQKVYLPLLSREASWTLAGAFTPSEQKRKALCSMYRIPEFSGIEAASQACDAVFIHVPTPTHFELASYFLQRGIDVYIDKPLAGTLEEAEQLAELSIKHGRKLMVGFNRRFAPMYVKAKASLAGAAWIRIEKHRMDRIAAAPYGETLLDGYIHLLDTARWIIGDELAATGGSVKVNEANSLVYAHHAFQSRYGGVGVYTGMHRQAGSGLELLEAVGTGRIIRVKDLHTCEIEEQGVVSVSTSGSWDSLLKEKGFEDAVHHFIACIEGDTTPAIDGAEALKTQQMLMDLINKA